MFEWLIIGGGVHGTYLSNVLVHRRGVSPDRVAVVDPHQRPMHRWWRCAENTGMKFLRSTAVHHIGLEPMGLLRFARSHYRDESAEFRPPYDRPSLNLFRAHCRRVVDEGNLRDLRRRARVEKLHDVGDSYRVITDDGVLESRRLMVATGASQSLRRPGWACELTGRGGDVRHVFDDDFHPDDIGDGDRIGICGLGISAAQLACRLAETTEAEVTLFSRHDVRVEQFDSDPCWLGPKCQVGFRRHDYRQRRKVIEEVRHRGTMPRDVAREFNSFRDDGRVDVEIGEVDGATVEDGLVCVELEKGPQMEFDTLVLATGFSAPAPDDDWLGRAARRMDLRRGPWGFPILDSALRWTEGLFVSGPLAELEIGPAARNIVGARLTAKRLKSVPVN